MFAASATFPVLRLREHGFPSTRLASESERGPRTRRGDGVGGVESSRAHTPSTRRHNSRAGSRGSSGIGSRLECIPSRRKCSSCRPRRPRPRRRRPRRSRRGRSAALIRNCPQGIRCRTPTRRSRSTRRALNDINYEGPSRATSTPCLLQLSTLINRSWCGRGVRFPTFLPRWRRRDAVAPRRRRCGRLRAYASREWTEAVSRRRRSHAGEEEGVREMIAARRSGALARLGRALPPLARYPEHTRFLLMSV